MPFEILKLPGELRNRIYDYAAEMDNPVHISDTKSPKERVNGEPTTNTPFAALARVCRRTREEYRPLQRTQARIMIDWADLDQYLATFHGNDADRKLIPKTLTIFLRLTGSYTGFADLKAVVVRTLPLLQSLQAVLKSSDKITFELDPDTRHPDNEDALIELDHAAYMEETDYMMEYQRMESFCLKLNEWVLE